ncbi:protein APCDD1 [Candidatus Magnetobacterium bavaricum]|uniref:Protein APCDD1 n=1 Tax=Candidatus Magnetobacterium bavaricum TaxID=29290 RepID=A0A0F3GM74_9BACT|nr:protein APCDD1 [Candidatus Magnetobacterium bavaricum]
MVWVTLKNKEIKDMGQQKILSNVDILIEYWKSKGYKGQHDASFNIYGGLIAFWGSMDAEDLGNGMFARRTFTFFEDTWSMYFTMFMDTTMKKPVYQFHGEGFFEVESPSSVVEGAYNVMFGFHRKTIRLLTSNKQVISSLGFDDCGLKLSIVKDISGTGCSFIKSVKDYEQEYDLLKLDATAKILRLGARPADGDMSTEARRPTTLGIPLKKL